MPVWEAASPLIVQGTKDKPAKSKPAPSAGHPRPLDGRRSLPDGHFNARYIAHPIAGCPCPACCLRKTCILNLRALGVQPAPQLVRVDPAGRDASFQGQNGGQARRLAEGAAVLLDADGGLGGEGGGQAAARDQ